MEKEWMNSSLIAYCKVAQKPMLNYSRDLLFTLFLSNDNNNDSSLPKSVVDNSTTRLLTLVEGADDSSSKQLCNKSNEFNNKSEKQVVDDLSRNHKYYNLSWILILSRHDKHQWKVLTIRVVDNDATKVMNSTINQWNQS